MPIALYDTLPIAQPFPISAFPAALVPVTKATQHQIVKTNCHYAEIIKHITYVTYLNKALRKQLTESINSIYSTFSISRMLEFSIN